MTEMYGSYSDEDLNEWERMSQNIKVLTSSAFGAWLLRGDKRIKEQEPTKKTYIDDDGWLMTYDYIEQLPDNAVGHITQLPPPSIKEFGVF